MQSPVCPSLACCGLKLNSGGPGVPNGGGEGGVGGGAGAANGGGRGSPGYSTGEYTNGSQGEEYWLECDDEQISIITRYGAVQFYSSSIVGISVHKSFNRTCCQVVFDNFQTKRGNAG